MILTVENTDGRARACRIETGKGHTVETPVFMPVATQAAAKALYPSHLHDAGVSMVITNALHLSLRPGSDTIRKIGGIHRFMGWDGAVVTDSGGFQIFSFGDRASVADSGVTFNSPFDGSTVEMGPESCMRVQNEIGADVAMAFDECVPYPCERMRAEGAVKRTILWAGRCLEAHDDADQALFGIVQGSVYEDLRRRCAKEIVGMGFDGYALGGLSVGEGGTLMREVLGYTVGELPEDRPRYLMGIGPPADIMDAIEMGIDIFDCVLPTRNGRNGWAYTSGGIVRIKNAGHTEDDSPLDPRCSCYCCTNFTRAYLRHLFNVDEMSGLGLVSFHNVHYFTGLLRGARDAIIDGSFEAFKEEVKHGDAGTAK